jgi:cytochrome d ubiquinol oxidase subunit I
VKLDSTILARIQFAFTVSFHIIFPTISIGLATFLAIVEGLWLKTKDAVYLQIYRFWLGIFAIPGSFYRSNSVSALPASHRSPVRQLDP